MPTLLIVDDEERIINALVRSLRREEFDIVTADTAERALRLLAEQPFEVILSDYKMPGMTGLALLSEVARLHPGTRRILITGWTADVSSEALDAIGVHAVIAKPWDDGELKDALRACFSAS
jgi:response regulator RpfG family c-di-GMP phosphodiesterase